MSIARPLPELLEQSTRRDPARTAVSVPNGPSLTYAELSALSDRLRDRLWHLGVRPGDRVGFRLHKSLDSVIALFGIMKAGAAYVPVDAESPAARGAFIFSDCAVKAVITEDRIDGPLADELTKLGASPARLVLDTAGGGVRLRDLLDQLDRESAAPAVPTVSSGPDDVAYILYTSGSTGTPKGVTLTHRNATSFIDWCSETFHPTRADVFSSHAPFHFDLSILDIFVSLKHGARLVLIGEALGKDPGQLAPVIAAERITVWYSTPSILSLLADYGKLDRVDASSLRIVFFAGEVFPIPRFRVLRRFWPHPRYVNLYGPTETNVCTFYEVPADGSWESMETFPIGRMCVPNEGRVVDEHDTVVADGQAGQLVVSGPNVLQKYWNRPDLTERAFIVDTDGRRWYRTGDVVVLEPSGDYRYMGRQDRMVKRRGYRVELGEIEAAMAKHPDAREVSVVSVPDPQSGVRITAFIGCPSDRKPSIIALKSFASQNLPPYMIPDVFRVVDALPRTSTDKVDLQTLKSLA